MLFKVYNGGFVENCTAILLQLTEVYIITYWKVRRIWLVLERWHIEVHMQAQIVFFIKRARMQHIPIKEEHIPSIQLHILPFHIMHIPKDNQPSPILTREHYPPWEPIIQCADMRGIPVPMAVLLPAARLATQEVVGAITAPLQLPGQLQRGAQPLRQLMPRRYFFCLRSSSPWMALPSTATERASAATSMPDMSTPSPWLARMMRQPPGGMRVCGGGCGRDGGGGGSV